MSMARATFTCRFYFILCKTLFGRAFCMQMRFFGMNSRYEKKFNNFALNFIKKFFVLLLNPFNAHPLRPTLECFFFYIFYKPPEFILFFLMKILCFLFDVNREKKAIQFDLKFCAVEKENNFVINWICVPIWCIFGPAKPTRRRRRQRRWPRERDTERKLPRRPKFRDKSLQADTIASIHGLVCVCAWYIWRRLQKRKKYP